MYDILTAMIRTRRLYAYSEKLYSFFLVIVLFAAGLYSLNLIDETTEVYRAFTEGILTLLSSTGILYGAYHIILLMLILLKDHMFLAGKFVRTLLHMLICSIILIVVQLLQVLHLDGLSILLA